MARKPLRRRPRAVQDVGRRFGHVTLQAPPGPNCSAIVHPAPAKPVFYFHGKIGEKVEAVDRGITARMMEFLATDRRFIGARNWLSLTMDDRGRIWAEWYAENEDQPYTKVIHRV